jgi:hypothetical protein
MRRLSLVTICGLLLAATACSDDSSGSGGEINSREDVQRFFAAIVPDLVEAFTELANDQSFATSALSSSRDKSAHISSVPCPGGGTLEVDLITGQATLTNCSVGGVTISATLALFVFPLPSPPLYGANFNGILMVSGSFNGTVEVTDALIEWTDPPTEATTFWDVTVIVNGQMFTVSSDDPGNGMLECNEPDPVEGPGSVPRNGPCDEDSDCQSDSCRDPRTNPSEGCTCGGSGGEDCSQCIGVSAGPDGAASSCPGQAVDFACTCTTETGAVLTFFISGGAGCVF